MWTPDEWARIERIARAERRHRAWLRTAIDLQPLPVRVHRAIADGSALELRQWSRVATGGSPLLITPVLERLLERDNEGA